MSDIYPSGEYRQFESEGIRNRREAIWRRIFERAAGALQAEVKDAIPCSPTRPPRELWQRTTIRPDSARQGRLIEICLTRGCSLEDAKELVQEAHLRLFMYQRSAHVRKPESLLRRILINLSINHYHRVLSSGFVFENIDKLDRDGILIDPTPDPEQTLAAEEQLDVVVSLVSAMSRRTCQIFIAQRAGYSYEEVAAAFAIKPRTVEKHVTLATSMLSEMIPGHFPPGVQSHFSKRAGSAGASPENHVPAIYRHPLEAPIPGYQVQRIRDEAFSKSS